MTYWNWAPAAQSRGLRRLDNRETAGQRYLTSNPVTVRPISIR